MARATRKAAVKTARPAEEPESAAGEGSSRALWSGVLQFGLVTIPVALRTAERPDELDLDLIDRRDHAPVGYKPYNKRTDRTVDRAQIVKGFEISRGRYVLVENEDLKRANVKATHTLDVVQFVELAEIDPRFFERPYYLTPGKHGERSYALLRDALAKSGRAALARLVIRTREHVAAIYPLDRALVVNLLRYAHELKDPKSLTLPAAGAARSLERELGLAEKLIDELTAPFDPKRFHDEYRDDLLAFLKRKASSAVEVEEADETVAKPRAAAVTDLMELLKKSVEQGPPRRRARAVGRTRRRARAVAGRSTAARSKSRRAS